MRRPALTALALLGAILLGLSACGRGDGYSQGTPEETIRTARLMVEQGKTDRLDRLIYAEDEDMRRLLRRVGVFLGNLGQLGEAVAAAFPAEVATLKTDLEASAKAGKPTGLLAQISTQIRPQGLGGRRQRDAARRQGQGTKDAFNQAIKQVFADPYGWLRESEGRLTTEYLTDDAVSLRWDAKPVLAPIGLQMKRGADGLWYFVLPLNIPGVQQFTPRNTQEYQIWGSLVSIIDNAVVDLTRDIESKRVTSLDQVARKAGEKAFVPIVMGFMAYGKAMEARKKEAATAAVAPAVQGK